MCELNVQALVVPKKTGRAAEDKRVGESAAVPVSLALSKWNHGGGMGVKPAQDSKYLGHEKPPVQNLPGTWPGQWSDHHHSEPGAVLSEAAVPGVRS